jgi:adenylate kinase
VKRRIVLLGPPASGKGTQSELIQKKFQIPVTSTGAILRREAKLNTLVGREAGRIISKGALAPDDLVLTLVGQWLDQHREAFLFDGFPRTLPQAVEFEKMLQARQTPLDLAIFLDASEPTIAFRMARRLTCSNCGKVVSIGRHVQSALEPCPNCGGKLEVRSDDNHAALALRLEEFREKSLPLIDFYSGRNLLAKVDANQEVDRVFEQISRVIQE